MEEKYKDWCEKRYFKKYEKELPPWEIEKRREGGEKYPSELDRALERIRYLERSIYVQESLIQKLADKIRELEKQIRELDWIKKIIQAGE